ncbi:MULTISPECIES: helix-turn-helix domain-containing protein [Acidiphilium]|uniref:Transcriptional regulator, XRE family n=1 Tax=Acidiphilium cryptum (strain JF-5) TaxID=349163 RepID=A5FTX4_ACICJ|nr:MULTISPECIES: helix-turn-helix transcriptional regulator [Acidiphilium]ABQ29056.1 transcriptional regulator, XRE family [Acidiphilium cryptum JF-5]
MIAPTRPADLIWRSTTMPKLSPLSREEMMRLRTQLADDVEAGGLPLSLAVRRMRKAIGFTQVQFAKAMRLTTRQIWEIENGKANPSLETMNKLAHPFGFRVGFISRHRAAAMEEADRAP